MASKIHLMGREKERQGVTQGFLFMNVNWFNINFRNISSPSALASIKSKIQEVKIIENEYSKQKTLLNADKTKDKAPR